MKIVGSKQFKQFIIYDSYIIIIIANNFHTFVKYFYLKGIFQ